MNREETFLQVQDIFQDVFDDFELTIDNSTNSDNIEEWDSLNHVSLVLAIEKRFNIRFQTGEVQALKDVGEMINLLEEKVHS